MNPNETANFLRRIAEKIENSKEPSRLSIVQDLKRVIAGVNPVSGKFQVEVSAVVNGGFEVWASDETEAAEIGKEMFRDVFAGAEPMGLQLININVMTSKMPM